MRDAPPPAAPSSTRKRGGSVMSMHRLTAGAGYQYLLRHTATGDCDPSRTAPLTAYYAESGNPAGRWLGTGLAGVAGGVGLTAGTKVTEEAMANLFGRGRDPITGTPLGNAYPVFTTAAQRIATATAALPPTMGALERRAAIETISRLELAKPTRSAVAGFDLTFTVQKSASALWAMADATTHQAVLDAHRAAVEQSLTFFGQTALFTRTGTRSCAQVPTRGLIAAAFDHWDTRTGDPNLHTHVVVANKVQGLDGAWRTVDSRALHHAVVSISEIYDNLFADELARRLPVAWGWRTRGPKRTPAFEVTGIGDDLLATFSTRSTQIDQAMTGAITDFIAQHGRGPNRVEVTRLRQVVTRATRPDKHVHPLSELLRAWRRRGQDATGVAPEQLVAAALHQSHERAMTSAQVSEDVVARLAAEALEQVMTRRSTWTRSNVLAEAARTTRGLRMASPQDRHALHARVVDAVLDRCVSLAAPELFTIPTEYQRPDGASVFTRVGEDRFTDLRVLDAENRLLQATDDDTAPTARDADVRVVVRAPVVRTRGRGTVTLAADQADAVRAIATSGRRVDVLVGPAGTGKTTTLLALRHVWEHTHGPGSVIGLAPSATAASELADALGVACENTAKWLYESTGPGHALREARIADATNARATINAHTHPAPAIRLERTLARLDNEARAWQIKPGQLLVVDEASLAGTFTLDTLTGQAASAGAKMLLVGDHAQLSAVDAGGAFHLLAERGRPTHLTSLWRFTHRWEARTTRLLRTGNPRALDAYDEHDRITSGPHEAMLEDAYTSWQHSEADGHSAILLAADTRTVDALNTRAHADRVQDGLVSPAGVTTPSGLTIGVGDRVLTRDNARYLHGADGGYVRNGDLWDVTGTHLDGSLTVRRATRDHTGSAHPRVQRHLDAGYVAEHVDLGYATTTHRAQGVTVDHAHVLAAPGMTRQNLYVAMTRGRSVNHAYVAIDDVDAACDGLPDNHASVDARAVLETILATDAAELSATQSMTRAQDAADALSHLDPIRQTLAADAATRRWRRLLPSCGLTEAQVGRLWASPDRTELVAALRRGDAAGHPMQTVVAHFARSTTLAADGLGPGDDITSTLTDRLAAWLDAHTDHDATSPPPIHREAVDPTDPAARTLAQIDELIATRVRVLTDLTIAARPAWLRPLGDQPTAGPEREAWARQVAAIVAHRDLAGGINPADLTPSAPPAPRPVAIQHDVVHPTATDWSVAR